jgi:hypothetical protein
MPYIHVTDNEEPANNVNILFIHIPKTAGTSITSYFFKKYNILKGPESLLTYHRTYDGIHFQHLLYSKIKNHNDCFRIDFNNLTVITCVRNPYYRIISDLFYFKLINKNSTSEEVYSIIKDNFLLEENIVKYDNHPLPQYTFILDTDGTVVKDIKILYTEHLTHNMELLGYNDFNIKENVCSEVSSKNYFKFLNIDSIKLINQHYAKDFEYFNYDMISELSNAVSTITTSYYF